MQLARSSACWSRNLKHAGDLVELVHNGLQMLAVFHVQVDVHDGKIVGGTVALHMANRNINTLDAGVPVLSMHAPYETVSKLDCYMTYKGIKVLFEA